MQLFLLVLGFFAGVFLVSLFAVAVAAEILRQADLRQAAAAGVPIAEPESDSGLFKDDSVSSISPWANLLERTNFIDRIRIRTAEAGLNWSVGRVCASMLLTGTIAFALLRGTGWIPGWAVLICTVLGAMSPYWLILKIRARRFREFEMLLPDVLDALCRALASGQAFAASIETAAAQSQPPVSTELRKTIDEWKFGSSWEDALDNLALRVPIQEVNVFAAAIKVQMRTGGRLGDLLNKLAETMRENAALRGEVRALAAHGRMTGAILTALPVAIIVLLLIVNPTQIAVLLIHPVGKHLISAAVFSLILAHFIIRRIVDIET